MTSLKIALLAAAAVAIAPTMAQAQDGHPRQQRGDRGSDDAPRPQPRFASPQAPRATLPAPLRAGDLGTPAPRQPAIQMAPQRVDAASPPARADRGGWGGPGMWRGARNGGQPAVQTPPQRPERADWQDRRQGDSGGRWQGDRGGTRPTPPQALDPQRNWQDRSQWQRDSRVGGDTRDLGGDHGRNDRRGDDGNRRQWDNGNRGQSGDGNRSQWNRGDGRRDANDHHRIWTGGDRRWDANRWRNDNRYDWRSWRDHHGDLFRSRYYAPRGYHYRSVYRGFFLEPFFYGSSYWLADPYEYRLPPVEWPLRWVRYYDDALLVDVTTGEVVDVVQGFFY